MDTVDLQVVFTKKDLIKLSRYTLNKYNLVYTSNFNLSQFQV